MPGSVKRTTHGMKRSLYSAHASSASNHATCCGIILMRAGESLNTSLPMEIICGVMGSMWFSPSVTM